MASSSGLTFTDNGGDEERDLMEVIESKERLIDG
jgi:hypothetical protein